MRPRILQLMITIFFVVSNLIICTSKTWAQEPAPSPPAVVVGFSGYACYNSGLVSNECDKKSDKVNEGFTAEKITDGGDRTSKLTVTGSDGNFRADFHSKINYKSADGPAFLRDTSAYLSVSIFLLDAPKNNYKVDVAVTSSSKVTSVRPPTSGMFGCPCNSAATEANIMEGKPFALEGPLSVFPGSFVTLPQYPQARYRVVYTSEFQTMARGYISNWDFDAGLFAQADLSLNISATSTNLGPDLKILDPACGSTTSCNGEFLELTPNSDGVQLKSKEELINANVERKGIVTDGVSKLLIRTPSNAGLTLTLKDPDGKLVTDAKYGILVSRDGSKRGFSLAIEPEIVTTNNKNYVFAVYETPINYPGNEGTSSTDLTLEVSFTATNTLLDKKKITLAPPPILLIHGIWSDPSIWVAPRGENTGLSPFLRDNGYHPYTVDYSSVNASAFTDPLVVSQLVTTLDSALFEQRTNSLAISQVDIIGHSMGGLITRAREGLVVAPLRPYTRPDNYMNGEFHKIFTIGTPHQGTPIANVLAANKCSPYIIYNPANRNRILFQSQLDRVAVGAKSPLERGIFSLQTSSPEIRSLPLTHVPSHAIVGIAPDDSDSERNANLFGSYVVPPLPPVDELLGGNGRHDLSVPTYSQIDGISGLALSVFNDVVHGIQGEVERTSIGVGQPEDTGEVESKKIWNRIVELLRTNVSKGIAVGSFGYFYPYIGAVESLPFYTCPPNQQLVSFESTAAAPKVGFKVFPEPGTVVHPGETIQITLEVEEETDSAAILVGGLPNIIQGPGPYTFPLKIHNNTTGRVNFQLVASSLNGQSVETSSYLIVQPDPLSIENLYVLQDKLYFDGVKENSYLRLLVVGRNKNGKEIVLSSADSGTKYKTRSSTDTVVSVDAEGFVRPRGIGTETIEISNSGKTTVAVVTVNQGLNRPEINILTPSNIIAGSRTTTVNIIGRNFTKETLAYIANQALSTSFRSQTELQIEIPASNLITPQNLSILVGNNGGSDQKEITIASAPSITNIAITKIAPKTIGAGEQKTVTIEATLAPSDTLLNNSVTLLRYNDKDELTGNLGQMFDDGTHGDRIAGDKIFTTQIIINEVLPQTISFKASAAYKGQLKRLVSPSETLTVTQPAQSLQRSSSTKRVTTARPISPRP